VRARAHGFARRTRQTAADLIVVRLERLVPPSITPTVDAARPDAGARLAVRRQVDGVQRSAARLS
jgi:hypothetical protein